MANNIIDHTDHGIVVKESPIHLSDEKLRNVLLRTYERAQQDAHDIKLHNFYGVFLSVAGTLFLTLLTSSFHALGSICAETVTTIVWIICAVSALAGFILLAAHVSEKIKSDTSKRDKAVDEIFEQHFKTE